MRVLIADDDGLSRAVLERTLTSWGHSVVVTRDGAAAWGELNAAEPPQIAILDWMMPEIDGPDICRRFRRLASAAPVYVILLTSRARKGDIIEGLESGADDYLTKPFDRHELRSRLLVGERVTALQRRLADRVRELEFALDEVKTLNGLLPICCYCKKIRDDGNYWQQVEDYVMAHTDAHFSHSICPTCWHAAVEPELVKRGVSPEAAKFSAEARSTDDS